MGRNQKGFTIIELIVVITIGVVLTGVITISLGYLGSWRLEKCAKNLEVGLAQSRAAALSRDDTGLDLSNVDGQIILELYNEPKKIIGDGSISITWKRQQGKDVVMSELAQGESLRLSFDRSSGAFLPLEGSESGNPVYCTAILMERRDKKKTVVLVPATGKFYVE